MLTSNFFLRLTAAPTPIAPRSQTPTRRRGSCLARKHALSNSSANAIVIIGSSILLITTSKRPPERSPTSPLSFPPPQDCQKILDTLLRNLH